VLPATGARYLEPLFQLEHIMNSKRFEHRIEQVSIPFKTQTSGVLFKSTEVTLEPDLVQLLQHDTFQALLGPQGTDGWELVSVQSICRGETRIGNQNAQGWAYGFAMPVGYLLFFKRETQS